MCPVEDGLLSWETHWTACHATITARNGRLLWPFWSHQESVQTNGGRACSLHLCPAATKDWPAALQPMVPACREQLVQETLESCYLMLRSEFLAFFAQQLQVAPSWETAEAALFALR